MVPWFTGSREKYEFDNNVNHKKITKKNLRNGEPNYVNQAYAWTKLCEQSIRVNQIYVNRTYVNQKVIFLMKKKSQLFTKNGPIQI